ncbi:MAG: molybdenum cofactor guanylyltransferase MobA [Pseudomonadota bacterium]
MPGYLTEPQPRREITGVILCGGLSRRMGGVDKPLLDVGGRSLLHYVIDRLVPQVQSVWLSCGTNAARFGGFGLPIVTDTRPAMGPLAGIEATLAQITTPYLFVCPGDAPVFPVNMCASLLVSGHGADVVFARPANSGHSLFLLLKADVANALTAWLNDGGRSVSGWLQHVRAQPVDFGNGVTFSNINTPVELQAFKRSITDEDQDSE